MDPRWRLFLSAERAFGISTVPAACAAKRSAGSGETRQAGGNANRPEPLARPAVAARQISPPQSTARPPANPVPVANTAAIGQTLPQPSLRTAHLSTIEPFTAALLSTAQKHKRLTTLDETQVRGCPKCRLCKTRTQTVFGEGDVDAKLMFIGEGPGENEDLTGRPFVGRAGQLLDKMIAAMGLTREAVYISNIVKCRPPDNRAPMADETEACTPYLIEQIEIVRPQVIVTLGLPATRYLLQQDLAMGKMRGQWHDWRGLRVMPTYHPAYVLRNPTPPTRAAVWSDLKQVMAAMGIEVPTKNESP